MDFEGLSDGVEWPFIGYLTQEIEKTTFLL
jgi:hypothetical protein